MSVWVIVRPTLSTRRTAISAASATFLDTRRRQLLPKHDVSATGAATLSQHRQYASKHPQGFQPPLKEDLDELRESVKEFASKVPRASSIYLAGLLPLFTVRTEEHGDRSGVFFHEFSQNEFRLDARR